MQCTALYKKERKIRQPALGLIAALAKSAVSIQKPCCKILLTIPPPLSELSDTQRFLRTTLFNWWKFLYPSPDTMKTPQVDITGIGENAVDHVLRLSQFPAPDGKVQIESATMRLGGQIATAITACRQWGLRARYIGSAGNDASADMHESEFARLGVETHLVRAPDTVSRLSYILVDRKSGSRAVLSRRARQLSLNPSKLEKPWIVNSRLLHLDAENPQASLLAAKWARLAGVPVMCDFDLPLRGIDSLLRFIDYPVISSRLACALTGNSSVLNALSDLHKKFDFPLVCATLGENGAVAWDGRHFWYSPAFRVKVVDTTGAGDLFHAGFAYGLLQGWGWKRILEFGCAAAGLNCTAEGARGQIGSISEIERLRKHGKRSFPLFTSNALKETEIESSKPRR
jgi:sugar/nucleoside kinase (ribokinase family)